MNFVTIVGARSQLAVESTGPHVENTVNAAVGLPHTYRYTKYFGAIAQLAKNNEAAA